MAWTFFWFSSANEVNQAGASLLLLLLFLVCCLPSGVEDLPGGVGALIGGVVALFRVLTGGVGVSIGYGVAERLGVTCTVLEALARLGVSEAESFGGNGGLDVTGNEKNI
jgi:hypothetical protein